MNKRYQVFVSSTFRDLQEERGQVIQALLELDCIPSGMELFPAADEDQWSYIQQIIDDCDYYVVVLAGKYGSISARTGKSYTQMEYEYAIEKGKPVIAFIHENPVALPMDRCEQDGDKRALLDEFRAVVQRKLCKHWSNADQLGGLVSRSMIQLIKRTPAVGWVRADLVPSEGASTEILQLRKQIEQLQDQLEKSRVDAPRGTEDFSQGDDSLEINYKYETVMKRGMNFEVTDAIDTNWNQLFGAIAPKMINGVTEVGLRDAINKFISAEEISALEHINEKDDNFSYINNIRIIDHDFQTIKIQLRTLGLIKQGSGARNWVLTPFGDSTMTKLRAVKRQSIVESAIPSEGNE
jgi:hypothetical protein